MQIAQVIGGYTLGGADLLRRAMGKKKAEEMAQYREIFRKGAAEKNIPQGKADEIFDLMEKFAGYGFNKSHAAAYSLLAYHTGWLKVHYTAEFYCANMTVEMDDTDKLKVLFEDAQDFGITFGKWGIPNGAYLFIPLLGPSTVRDSAGLVARAYSNPLSYIPDVAVRNTIYGVNYLDTRAQALPGESVLETASIDKYRYLRSAYLRARRYKVFEGKPPPEEEDENQ